jgi:hypothetical protein
LAPKRQSFNPKSFLAKIGEGRSVAKYSPGQTVFLQGDPADAIFYIQKGKVKVTVVSEQGKEAIVVFLGVDEFFRRGMPRWPDTTYNDGHRDSGLCRHATGEGGSGRCYT